MHYSQTKRNLQRIIHFTKMMLFILTILCLTSISAEEVQGGPSIQGHASNTRIIGGYETPIAQYPYAGAIHVQTGNSKFFCGGALWGSQWILTAGQCVDGAILFTIQLGSATLEGDDPNRVTVATSDYYLHPDYNPDTLDNDIGLIKLRLPVTHTIYLKSFNTLGKPTISTTITHYVIGWGQTSDYDSTLSNHLNVAFVAPISNQECKRTYGNQITDNMVCIVGGYNQGTCHGDTGSPLIEHGAAGTASHLAIASFISANGCDNPDPSGYTRTYPYVDWINSITSS